MEAAHGSEARRCGGIGDAYAHNPAVRVLPGAGREPSPSLSDLLATITL